MIQDRQYCPMRHCDNGNCLVLGGFCTSVSDPICEALHSAYDCGKRSINPEDLRKKGRWEPIGDDDMDEGYYKCTSCGYEAYFYSGNPIEDHGQKYCPYCGAKMEE